MGAKLLDGAATAQAIKQELRAKVAALAERGVRPGLGVLLLGDDPASAVYVGSKTRACDELGLGENARAALITRGLAEIQSLTNIIQV